MVHKCRTPLHDLEVWIRIHTTEPCVHFIKTDICSWFLDYSKWECSFPSSATHIEWSLYHWLCKICNYFHFCNFQHKSSYQAYELFGNTTGKYSNSTLITINMVSIHNTISLPPAFKTSERMLHSHLAWLRLHEDAIFLIITLGI